MLNKVCLAPFPKGFFDIVSFLPPCVKHSFTQCLCSACKTPGSRAITVKEIAESKCGKGVEAEERGEYSSGFNLFTCLVAVLNFNLDYKRSVAEKVFFHLCKTPPMVTAAHASSKAL